MGFLHQSFSLCRLHAVCPCAAAGFSRFAPDRRRHDTFRQQPPCFYGLSFIESFKKMKTQLYMIFSLSDETYSVLCSCKNEDPEEKNRPAWFLINLFDQSYWIIGSVIGALLGQVLPFDFTGIDKSGRCRLSLKKSPTNCRLLLLLF